MFPDDLDETLKKRKSYVVIKNYTTLSNYSNHLGANDE